jgi:hypothetical protein
MNEPWRLDVVFQIQPEPNFGTTSVAKSSATGDDSRSGTIGARYPVAHPNP